MQQNTLNDYELLVFAGTIESIEASLETNMFSSNFVFKYNFNCIGIEKILANLYKNSYLFFDGNSIIDVAGIPFFDNNCYKQGAIRAFTANGFGDVWTRADLLQYVNNTITLPFSDVVVSIEYSSDTLRDLLSLPVSNVKIIDYKQLLDVVCGQLFNYYFYYTENENNIITLHIRIVSFASNDDAVSFINLHGTAINAVENKPIDQLILTYPLIVDIEGVFKIFRHTDNFSNEALYSLTNDDIEYCKAIHGEEAVINEAYWDKNLLNLAYRLGFNALVPEKVDECLRNSAGYKLGVHRKFLLSPLFNITINGVNYIANLEEFEILELQSFLRMHNGIPVLWRSKRPYSDMVITIDGNYVQIESDIPHQIAPPGYVYPHSMIEKPVFPINDGDEVYLKCIAKSTVSRKYVTIGNGVDKKIIDIEQPLTDEQASVLANYLFSFFGKEIRSFNITGPALDWLIDYIFCFGKKINKLYFVAVSEPFPNPFTDEIPINLLVNSFSINRTGSIYTFSVNANLIDIDWTEIVNAFLLKKNEIPFQKQNSIKIEGNINGVFRGKIININFNHYEVLPEWAENENEIIDVARVDELKLGYWANNPPSEDISFLCVENENGEWEPSKRIEIIKKNGVEQDRLLNVVVPDEKLYPYIDFKMGSGRILTIKRLSDVPPLNFVFLKAQDINTYSRTFAEVLE